ncbi:hypothetical protein [Helicobacter cinaedi]|uniref:hypothetical protein n=1 Tax=Helicobacter cinaedi TaxID=213 RepID=UPI000D7C97D0|nr:hypothetical protein [Helicobacter cinaedi]
MKKSGAYVGYTDGYPAGFIENFKTGQRINWKFELNRESQNKPFTNVDFEAIRKANEAKAAKRANELLSLNEKTALHLRNEYDNASLLQGEHSYLKSKGVKADGSLKVDEFNNLLIPLSH